MPKLSPEAEEDGLRGIDFIEARFGMEAVQRLQAADPRSFDIQTFMIGMAIRMVAEYRRSVREILAELRQSATPKDG